MTVLRIFSCIFTIRKLEPRNKNNILRSTFVWQFSIFALYLKVVYDFFGYCFIIIILLLSIIARSISNIFKINFSIYIAKYPFRYFIVYFSSFYSSATTFIFLIICTSSKKFRICHWNHQNSQNDQLHDLW